ncbi:MAG TPA: hypothetical protein VGZ22_23085 [Isosphaeraceae bacterium]|jgi:hypothetical protein|nr:hypothetical protein [Isosphaeraceae bacterium]
MNTLRSRRGFLADVGSGMLVATVGYGLATDLGLTPALADESERLTFGALEPLVGMMQETSADRLVPAVVELLNSGTELRQLLAAAALANARTFGGEDYVGFHTMMALAPAFHMASELPAERRPLPVIKVLYRNTNRIQESGGRKAEVLRTVAGDCCLPEGVVGGELLRKDVRSKSMDQAERTFATIAQGSPEDAFNSLLFAVQDNTDVHRVVLPYRAWDLLGLIGKEQAHTLLRQSVHYCVKAERDWPHSAASDRPRELLPKLLDQYKLLSRPLGTREADDAWVDKLSQTIFSSTADQAADAAAAALAEGMAPAAIGEAITLAANQLVLRDVGRTEREVQPGKPLGSVHGDSIGVHACDSATAWRNMARVSNPRNTAACLILGAYQVAYDRVNRGGDFLHWHPHPISAELEPVKASDPDGLLKEAEAAIRANDQMRACAVVHRYGELGHAHRPVFDLLLRFAISEDGALHAEKYYRTVSEEFGSTRAAFRWRQLTALARVTASEYGRPAPGYAEACEMLKV